MPLENGYYIEPGSWPTTCNKTQTMCIFLWMRCRNDKYMLRYHSFWYRYTNHYLLAYAGSVSLALTESFFMKWQCGLTGRRVGNVSHLWTFMGWSESFPVFAIYSTTIGTHLYMLGTHECSTLANHFSDCLLQWNDLSLVSITDYHLFHYSDTHASL